MVAVVSLDTPFPTLVTTTTDPKNIILEEVGVVTYIGKAPAGTLSSAAAWQMQELTTSAGGIRIKSADSGNFTQIWDNRASLTYV